MDKHKKHIQKRIKYLATCETCQREQLGPYANGHIRSVSNFAFVRSTRIDGRVIEDMVAKQPHYRGCE